MKRDEESGVDHVRYDVLDAAKSRFIEAARRTLGFAADHGAVVDAALGASANVFTLSLRPFVDHGHDRLHVTLITEGLGTADDARPDDLSTAELVEFWTNIGLKTVATMTNDAASAALRPVLLSLYLPSATPDAVFTEEFLRGFLDGLVSGCQTVGCVYLSGETPQLKSKIFPGRLDIAGAVFAVSPPGVEPIDGTALAAGDRIVLVESSGPHENGFTTLRALADRLPKGYRTRLDSGEEFWRAINRGSILYAPLVADVVRAGVRPTNIEPITGHGWQKLMRARKPLRYNVRRMPPVLDVFRFIERHLGVTPRQMIEIFNYGAGLAIFVRDAAAAGRVVELAEGRGLRAVVAGDVAPASRREVHVEPLGVLLTDEHFALHAGG